MIHQPCIILKSQMVTISDEARIDGFCKLEGGNGLIIGKGVHISSFVHLNVGGGRLIIGDYCAITSHVSIVTGSNTMAGRSMSSVAPPDMHVIERGEVILDRFVFVGTGARILPGVHVGAYAVIAAGAVVTRDVPAFAIVKGVPARQVGDRRNRADWNAEWAADVPQAPPVDRTVVREQVKAGMADKYGFQPPDQYADDFVLFVESMIRH